MDQNRIRALIEPVIAELGAEPGIRLVEVRQVTEHGRAALRVMIDKEGGITADDCQRVSREIGTLLDVEESIRSRYDLEVSSPGLDRPLVEKDDFVRHAGKVVSLRTRESIEGRRNFKGVLKGVEGGRAIVVIDGQEHRVPLVLIERAHLVY